MKRPFFCSSFILALLLVPGIVRADAQADLAAGKEALQKADLAKALTLLQSTAEALPKSVEAQLALGEAQLRLGHVGQALAQYHAVIELSPDHAHAKRMVAALTANNTSYDNQLATAKALMSIDQFDQANMLLERLSLTPGDAIQKNTIRLLSAECQLWSRAPKDALSIALQIVAQDEDESQVNEARVIAALALLQAAKPDASQVDGLLADAVDLAQPWKSRAAAAKALSRVGNETDAADTSSQLLALASMPRSRYRTAVIGQAAHLIETIKSLTDQGKSDDALKVLWPMISGTPVPAEDVTLKPVNLSKGWLMSESVDHSYRRSLVDLLTGISYAQFQRDPAEATFAGHWLAVEVIRQSPGNINVAKEILPTIGHLGAFSHRARTWKKGEILSRADQLQRELIVRLSSEPMSAESQKKLVELLIAHIGRYQQVSDVETGLAQFATLGENALKLAGKLDDLRSGGARTLLLANLASAYNELGETAFNKLQSAVVHNAKVAVNQFDTAALTLLAELDSRTKGDKSFSQSADEIIARYVGAGHWDAAINALEVLHGSNETSRRWSSLRLRIRQATNTENKLLAARRAMEKQLAPLVKTSLEEAAAIVKADPRDRNRQIAIFVADQLISRYAQLNRTDLSELVIATVAGDDEANALHDWSLWSKASLLDAQAAKALATVVKQTDDRSAIALHNLHKVEIARLGEIISNHPASKFADSAITRLEQITATYESYQAFDTAQAVLADFLKAQANVAAAERLKYRIIQVALAKAQYAFNQRPDKTKAPTELLVQHTAAIDALTAFLKTHPTGDYSPRAEDDLFAIARLYGNADAWSVTRTVLDRFTAAIPNFRSPAHLKLLQAATFLGQLDRQHGLSLLTAAPANLPPNEGSITTAIAMTDPTDVFPGFDDIKKGDSKESGSQKPGGFGGGIAGDATEPNQPFGGAAAPATPSPAKPSESSLAMIRQSQQRQYQRIAMLETPTGEGRGGRVPSRGSALPSGVLISAAEMQRQDNAADKAYEILIDLINDKKFGDATAAEQAREQVQWLFGIFENQLRADRAIVLIKRYLGDNPTDPERTAFAYRSLSDQIVWVRQRKPSEIIDQAWIDARHELFQQARKEIVDFVTVNAEKRTWAAEAQLLLVNSFEQEAQLAGSISAERAGGLLVQCAESIFALLNNAPEHPQTVSFPNRIWGLADRIAALGQNEQAIYILRQLSIKLPTHALANQSLVRVAQLYAANLSNPLRAVETYQDYLSRTDGDPAVPAQIFEIARQLATQERYLEAIHVYNVFVDSFPTDQRAASALHAIGKTHQANEAWTEAITTYDRIVEEYAVDAIIPQVRLDVAECRINLGQWSEARRLYEEFLEKFPKNAQFATASGRLDVLKKLDRFQDLLADDQIDRNKDDAQYQIARTVLLELKNPVKAIEEFRKVVAKHAKSDVADDAQVEIGRALLSLNRLEEGREELLKVAPNYPGSPLADDALFLVAQSFEQFAQQLAGVTQEKAYEESFRYGQKEAYARFNKEVAEESERMTQRRVLLKAEGDEQQIALNDALDASRSGNLVAGKLFCHVTQAELEAETETALHIANRQDRINDAYREAISMYVKAATDHPLGDKTDQSLIRIAEIFETRLKDRPAAMQTYQKVVRQFPGTPVAENAAWKVTQFYVDEGKYAQAADSYKTFIRNYPASPRVADAQFGLAEVLEHLGKWVEAMDAYEIFRQKFNKHPKVRLATDQISWIKTYRK